MKKDKTGGQVVDVGLLERVALYDYVIEFLQSKLPIDAAPDYAPPILHRVGTNMVIRVSAETIDEMISTLKRERDTLKAAEQEQNEETEEDGE